MTSQEGEKTTASQLSAPPSSDTALPSSPASAADIVDLTSDVPTNPRLSALAAKRANLEQKLASLETQRTALITKTTLPSGLAMPEDWSEKQRSEQAMKSANAIIKEHIGLLHKYNEIKDIGQGLLGLIADQRGVRVAEVMEDFQLGTKD